MTTAANVTLYIGSAILSIYFVGGVYKEYAAGASIMEDSEKPVAALDNPTVTLCFESWSELNLGAWYYLYVLSFTLGSVSNLIFLNFGRSSQKQ